MKKKYIGKVSFYQPALIFFVLFFMLVGTAQIRAVELTLDDALDIALNRTPRGGIIKGNLEVAEQQYNAKRINFYLPKISINGSIPSYSEDESYRFFGGSNQKSLFKTRNVDFNSFIKLEQSFLIGGDLEITANLVRKDEQYPNTDTVGGIYDEYNRQGYFNFTYKQPLLKPSQSKYDLKNLKDDQEIALYTKIEDEGTLRSEVTEAFMGILQSRLNLEITTNKTEKARLQVQIDSAKFADGVLSEEGFLESRSALLDAELEKFEAETSASEKNRELTQLLDIDPSKTVDPVEPVISEHYNEDQCQALINNWENSVGIKKAEHQYYKSKREADYSAGSHGLTGDLTANYSFGNEKITKELDGIKEGIESIKPSSWGVALNFTIPLWDGGSSGAAVRAARFQADQARLEYESKEKSAKAEIINLVNSINVSFRRLKIIEKQIELADNKLSIADSRFKDGQISSLEFLENRIFYLETKDKYLEELKNYLTNRLKLESKFINL
ncbi:MAG: TolC family protein [candidate division Zixibacteria bacterium]|nr:TolC family protein [candidate division Zixibacteria bacterium]